MTEQFSSVKVLELMISICLMIVAVIKSAVKVFLLGNHELHPQDLNTLDGAVASTGEAASSDECEDYEVMKILGLLFIQRV